MTMVIDLICISNSHNSQIVILNLQPREQDYPFFKNKKRRRRNGDQD